MNYLEFYDNTTTRNSRKIATRVMGENLEIHPERIFKVNIYIFLSVIKHICLNLLPKIPIINELEHLLLSI